MILGAIFAIVFLFLLCVETVGAVISEWRQVSDWVDAYLCLMLSLCAIVLVGLSTYLVISLFHCLKH